MTNLDFQMIALTKISADPNQPRKFYEDNAMQELTASIKASGVLQPILVRPTVKDKYMLICGERRFRASQQAGLKNIPAVIRKVTDEEALQLQIVENLQRKDVHPMEEAVAFKSFIEGKDWSIEEVAKRVGKTEYFVKQRLKLNSLSEAFQKLFYTGKMTMTTAMNVAVLPTEIQDKVYAERIDSEDEANPDFVFEINKYQINVFRGDLNDAKFDLTDATLNAFNPISCQVCPYNSAYAQLFPEDKARCNNIDCYTHKTSVAFERNLEAAKRNPSILIISGVYNIGNKLKEQIARLTNNGTKVYLDNEYDNLSRPDMPCREDFEDDNDTVVEDEADYQRAVERYHKDIDAFNKKIASGGYHEAFVLDGSDKGTYVHIQLKKGVSSSSNTETTSSPADNELETIEAEIARIQSKEKRSTELDAEKVWSKVRELVSKPELQPEKKLNAHEVNCFVTAILNKMSWNCKREWESKTDELSGEDANKVITTIARAFILDVLPTAFGSHQNSEHNKLAYDYIHGLLPQEVELIEIAQSETAMARIERVQKRLDELNAKKKVLKASLKKAEKTVIDDSDFLPKTKKK
jgi:ParB family transcriptional regulator, chromosome partitioning protein